MAKGKAQLDRLQPCLTPGEEVLWAGKPDLGNLGWRLARRALIWGLLIGCIFFGVGFVEDVTLVPEQSSYAGYGLLPSPPKWYAVGITLSLPMTLLFLFPGVGRAWTSLYAVTDRALIWIVGGVGRRFPLSEIQNIALTRYGDGTGTITFLGLDVYDRRRARHRHPSFDALIDVEQVLAIAQGAAGHAGHEEPSVVGPGAPQGHRLKEPMMAAALCAGLVVSGPMMLAVLGNRGPMAVEWRVPFIPPLLATLCMVGLLYAGTIVIVHKVVTRPPSEQRTPSVVVAVAMLAVVIVLLVLRLPLIVLLGGGAQGVAPIRLTDHPADDVAPSWSPDGQRLVFASKRRGRWDVYVMDVSDTPEGATKGSAQLSPALIHPGQAPAWSPDGQHVALVAHEMIRIVRVDAPRSEPLRSEGWSVSDESTLTWSPDGRHLAYGDLSIHVMSVHQKNTFPDGLTSGFHPGWSPDGKRMVLVARGRTTVYFGTDIHILDLATGERTPVTQYHPRWHIAGDTYHYPTWSPDGERIAYVYEDGLYLMGLDGANTTLLTRGKGPAWSPDGRTIAYTARRRGNWDIHVIPARPRIWQGWVLARRWLILMALMASIVLASGRQKGFAVAVALGAAALGGTKGIRIGVPEAVDRALVYAYFGTAIGAVLGTALGPYLRRLHRSYGRETTL